MNDFEAWKKILAEWDEVNRMKRLNQDLYDVLGGAILYIDEYAKKNKITLPNKDAINRMIGRIHISINEIEKSSQTPNLNTDKNNESDPDNLPVLEI